MVVAVSVVVVVVFVIVNDVVVFAAAVAEVKHMQIHESSRKKRASCC